MPDDELRNAFDALCARLQSDLQTQIAKLGERHADEREAVRRETEAKAAEHWAAQVDAVRNEWQSRLQAGLADAAADADRRVSAETERSRVELEKATDESTERVRRAVDAVHAEWQGRLQAGLAEAAADADRRVTVETEKVREEFEKAAAESAARVRGEVDAVRDEWQQRLQAELVNAGAEAERRVTAETERVRVEVEQAAAESTERVRTEMELAAAESTATVREEMEQAAGHATSRLREEMEQAAAHSTGRLREEMEQALAAERERVATEIEAERTHALTELVGERDRTSVELEAERLRARALTTAVEKAQAALAHERETARSAAESVHRNQEAVAEARAAERQSQLAVVERLLGTVRTISQARSLSDTLTALTSAASSVAPRVALFIVNGRELQGWRAAGFGDDSPASLRVSIEDSGLLAAATTTGVAVSTATASAPAFAALAPDRAALAVPITVGGQSVAVLYADDGSTQKSETPASWPEAIQILGAHASSCLAHITAVRTAQAMRATTAAVGGAPGRIAAAGTEEESSARRYARLLVSEIKLYNEAAVRMGREKRDLLTRLRPEIERARRLYEERVSPSVGARGVYFQQELVHTLADGDSALLGEPA